MTNPNKNTGKVILVGAGPGDPGLITVKGKSWLERADVIVYDYLANVQLLQFAREKAEIIYAGKKEGQYTLKQEDINKLLIQKAKQGKTVIRLKGGDPFLFGRGGEETVALNKEGIPFAVVPGVPSPMGVSAYSGIPLTHRDFSSMITIVTGSNEKGKEDLHIDWEKIASRSGTLVFLMGARKLGRITENLIKFGKDPNTPIAVIQWGTTFKQKTWTGTLSTIVDIAYKEKISPPALTIVGEVVELKPLINWYETSPLFGKAIVITRAENQSNDFTNILIEKGAEPVHCPVIETIAPDNWGPLDQAINRLETYDNLIFTSTNGVRFFTKRLKENDKDIRELKGLKIFCIGPKTAEAVNQLGIKVDLVPEKYVAESLLDSLGKDNIRGKKFLLPRASVAREILPENLRKLGAEIDVVPAYKTVIPEQGIERILNRLKEKTIDIITFTASSTVNNFMEGMGTNAKELLDSVTIACIGPITAKTAQDHGLHVNMIAEKFTVEGLIETLETFYQENQTLS